ncbi:hypothetical protein LguiA_003292 [Lonicera macranthoides]
MDARISPSLQLPTWIDSEKIVRKPSGLLRFHQRSMEKERLQMLVSCHLQYRRAAKRHNLVSCSSQNHQASALEFESLPASIEEALVLKSKSEEIEPYLDDRCIYLVGMMGSGKTTIGRILAEVLGYSFFDSDKLIEQDVGGTVVSDIFKLHGESFFRNTETKVLQKLSFMHQLVVSTGGGAVVRPINWKYMHKGISVWLDVPLEALAHRITSVGTNSRPLLHHGEGDTYTKTFKRLSTLWEERSEAYTNANARVSLDSMMP